MNVEYITVPLQLKSLESGQFEGYGSTFGNIDYGGDVVMRGAFKESLQRYKGEGDLPQMFWMHKPDQVPGVWLEMSEDASGLKVKGETIETAVGKDLQVMLKRKAVRAMSIGFSIDDQDDIEYRDGVRLLHRINLWEVSPVTMPMNPKAKINAVKALLHKQGKGIVELKRELEQFFRDKGLSKSQAIAFASKALADDDLEVDFGATLNSSDSPVSLSDSGSEHKDEPSSETPDEIEITAGLADFKDRSLLFDLDKRLKRISG